YAQVVMSLLPRKVAIEMKTFVQEKGLDLGWAIPRGNPNSEKAMSLTKELLKQEDIPRIEMLSKWVKIMTFVLTEYNGEEEETIRRITEEFPKYLEYLDKFSTLTFVPERYMHQRIYKCYPDMHIIYNASKTLNE